jgi:superfamily I DNA and RNA helicase
MDEKTDFDNDIYIRLTEALQKISNIKPRKKRDNIIDNLSYGGKIKRIEKEIANLDQWQKKAALELPDGPQRIRGLAGSGKTIVLALKAAYLHSQFPDWNIAVTYYTRALSQQLIDLIRQFSFEFSGEEPNWDKINIMHAWGISSDGIYSTAARLVNMTPLNYSNAKQKFGKGNEFKGVCDLLIPALDDDKYQIYDAILIDEAQDLPSSFFKIVFYLTKPPKRITWAYDELQNLSESSMPTLEEMYGRDKNGNLNVVLENKEDQAQQDITLPICYRNPPWALTVAHALGFGIYREKGIVQMFDEPDVWDDIGYKKIRGEISHGNNVVLKRSEKATPNYFYDLLSPEECIQSYEFNSAIEQYSWVAEQIKINITKEELDPDDILVIFPDAYYSKNQYNSFKVYCEQLGIKTILAGIETSRDVFRIQNHITCSSIFRAKGNEAPMVYILNSEFCSDDFELIKLRNIIFTAITRSRGWIRICGVGERMELLNSEIKECIEKGFILDFDIPSKNELEKIRKINRERTLEDKRKHIAFNKSVIDLIKGIEEGNLDPELIPELNALINVYKNKLSGDNDHEE